MFATAARPRTLVNELRSDDRIIATIQDCKNSEGRARLPTYLAFNGDGKLLNPDGTVSMTGPHLDWPSQTAGGGAAPKFDEVAFMTLQRSGKRDEAQKMADAYLAAQEEYERAGGATSGSLAQVAISRVLTYLTKHYGVRTTDGDGPVVDPKNVICRPAYREGDEPVKLVIQLAPVWG